MKSHRLHYSVEIEASKSQIWSVLWDSYGDWAEVFFDGSYAVTDHWKEGSTVLFLAPDQSGIYSIIEQHIPNNIMKFRHIGNVLNGKKQPVDDEAKKWSGATEVYKLEPISGINTLTIEIDVMDEHLDFMQRKLPIALEKIKMLSESE
ncbi:hypothetical protein [Ekhidna sp.]|uniref:hypothetical protein n=1 Tax=Ekhidna sp. TaxID=2608089 RepID=UPI003B50713A